jgi:hypothetical protein
MPRVITKYCNTDPGQGWRRLTHIEQIAPDAISFERGGLQILATVRISVNHVPFVHLSIGICPSLAPHLTHAQLLTLQSEQTRSIIQLFFGDRVFIQLPPDPRLPDMTHWAIKVDDEKTTPPDGADL